MRHMITAGLLILALATGSASAQSGNPGYRKVASIPLPDGRWDLLSVDPVHRRVLVARGDTVSVIDMLNGGVRSIGSIGHGHAAVAINGTDLVAVTSGGDDSVRLIDGTSGQQSARIAVGKNPDAAFYDSASKRLIVMNAEGGTVSVVDPRAARVVRTITVKPALELGTLIAPATLAINNEDASEVDLVDLNRGVALAPIALAGCEGPTGIAFDKADSLLLSACANGVAALVDTRMRRVVRLLAIDKGPDGALFDPKRRRFLVPCGKSGTLAVFAVGKGRAVVSLGSVATEVSARTAALDPATGRIYLPAATFAPPAQPGARPTLVPGSVHLIVLEPA